MMNLLGRCLTFILLFSWAGQAFCYEIIGEVIKLRGQVTQLRPGEKLARKVRSDEELFEDTSVLTGPKSMVMIRLRDRSTLTLGPESKMVLVEVSGGDDPGVVSLLNGRLRSEVRKQNSQKDKNHKQFISTRSAAMGVRGTDFVVSHNGDNNVTSLVTLKGEVDMARIDESYIQNVERSLRRRNSVKVERDEHNSPEIRELSTGRLKAKWRLKLALKSQKASRVGAGHHSGTVAEFDNVSLPVRIAPVQFAALYKNRDFAENNSGQVLKGQQNFVLPKGLKYASASAPPLGVKDQDRKSYAPKAGGFIDLETALYIPPDKDAAFNENYDLFVSNKTGGIDAETGNYVAPAGLELDPVKGFIVDKDHAAALASEQRKLLAQNTKQLNQQLDGRFIVGAQKDVNPQAGPSLLSSRELMTKNILNFTLQSYNQSLNYQAPTSTRDFDSSGVKRLDLSLAHSSGKNWQLITGLSYKDVSFKKTSVSQDNSGLFGLKLGARFYLSSRLNVVSSLRLEQDHFIEELDAGESLSSVNSTFFSAGLEWQAIRSSNWSLGLEGHLLRAFSKKTRELETQGSFGFDLRLLANYWPNQKSAFEFGPRFYQMDQDQNNPGSNATLNRDEIGLVLGYKRIF